VWSVRELEESVGKVGRDLDQEDHFGEPRGGLKVGAGVGEEWGCRNWGKWKAPLEFEGKAEARRWLGGLWWMLPMAQLKVLLFPSGG